MKNLILSLIFLLVQWSMVNAQNYDVRFNRTSVNCQTKLVCYDVQIKANGPSIFNLAGQNYRIYYNAALASYTTGTSALPNQYGGFSLVQNIQDVDASSINGPLDFEATLGFLNYAIDLNDTQNGGIELIPNEWTTTSNLCFIIESEVFNNPNICLEMVWGREGLTDSYGTAFVEISRWVSTNLTTASSAVNFDDLNLNDGDQACFNESCQLSKLIITDVSINEDEDSVAIQVCLTSVLNQDVNVNISASDGTAKVGLDFGLISNSLLIIPAGQSCSMLNIPMIDDAIYEGTETFTVSLSNPSSNATIMDTTAIVTILDNETIPTLSINSVSISEFEDTADLIITLSGPAAAPVSFTVNTTNGSALANVDYVPIINQNFNIPAGQTTITISVQLLDDTIVEGNEMFQVTLSNASTNAIISQPTGMVTIVDNDQACGALAPVISGN